VNSYCGSKKQLTVDHVIRGQSGKAIDQSSHRHAHRLNVDQRDKISPSKRANNLHNFAFKASLAAFLAEYARATKLRNVAFSRK